MNKLGLFTRKGISVETSEVEQHRCIAHIVWEFNGNDSDQEFFVNFTLEADVEWEFTNCEPGQEVLNEDDLVINEESIYISFPGDYSNTFFLVGEDKPAPLEKELQNHALFKKNVTEAVSAFHNWNIAGEVAAILQDQAEFQGGF